MRVCWSGCATRAVCKSAGSRLGSAARATPIANLGRLWAVRRGPATAINDQQRPQTASSPARREMTPHLARRGIQYQRNKRDSKPCAATLPLLCGLAIGALPRAGTPSRLVRTTVDGTEPRPAGHNGFAWLQRQSTPANAVLPGQPRTLTVSAEHARRGGTPAQGVAPSRGPGPPPIGVEGRGQAAAPGSFRPVG